MLKRHLSLLLVVLLLAQLVSTISFATDEPELDLSFEESAQWDDPEYYRHRGDTLEADTPQDSASYANFVPRDLNSNEVLRKGIDVSYYQNTINWPAVKADGVEFAIIRVGYRGYGSGQLVKDPRFDEYMQKAIAAGVEVGVYIYSQATTPAEAQEEARFILDRIKNYHVTLPLVIDFEFAENSDGYTGRLYNADLTKAEATTVCNAFIGTVTNAGYRGMTYANKFMLDNHLNPSGLKGTVWLAQYARRATYTGAYEFWQCSDRGNIAGIGGGTDINYWFDSTNGLPFRDVLPSRWSYGNILSAYNQGLVAGMTPTTFCPSMSTTRGQLVSMLYRMNGSPAVTGTCPFTDLTQDYYKKPILWAYQKGIISGRTANTFAPNDPITRQDLICILYRIKKPSTSGSLSGFTDAGSVSSYAKAPLSWGVSVGLIDGFADKTLQPRAVATREQAVAFLMRYQGLK